MIAGKACKNLFLALLLGGALAASGCTHAPTSAEANEKSVDTADPIEPVNRGIYKFNSALDTVVLRPVTKGYRAAVPDKGREMVSNFVENLYTPVVFGNSVLQGDPQNSFATLWRFVLNTTFGVGGLFDFASAVGLKNRPADLGETMAMYGADTGPYLVLPLIGPSNLRDAVGRLGDAFMTPTNYMNPPVTYTAWGLTVLDTRSNNDKLIDDINASSLDPYATFRSGYTQKRQSDIRKATKSRDKALEKAAGR